jgi:hypothetical protein
MKRTRHTRADVASACPDKTKHWRYARMAKIVPSERLRRELDEVLAGLGEHDDPVEAVARVGARLGSARTPASATARGVSGAWTTTTSCTATWTRST